MKTISYKRISFADVWQAFTGIVVGVTFLGCCFAWATDPRPVQGSPECAGSRQIDYSQAPATWSWNAERDCKAPLWRF